MAIGMSTACWSRSTCNSASRRQRWPRGLAQLVGLGLHVAQPLGDKDGHKDEHSLLVKVYM